VSNKNSVFLLAGNRLLREALARILKTKGDLSLAGAVPYTQQAIQQIASSACEILLVDSVATAVSDVQFVREAIQTVPGLKVILIDMHEDEESFLRAVRAGVAGYLLKDASAMDVIAAVRAVSQGEAVCPPRLCLSLFRYVAREWTGVPSFRVKTQLGLTRRQQQLVPLIAQGLSNKEIASHMHLSEQTVKNHVHRMLQKVGVNDRLAVVEMVRDQGLAV
jgi:DNA-binding NarL/FixJ family response regulator